MQRYFIFLAFLITILPSCTQEEGLGGNASIRGSLVQENYDKNYSVFQNSEAAKDEDVFLIFGDEKVIGDKTETSYNGHFKFENLWPGEYTLFYYSEDSSLKDGNNLEVIRKVKLNANENVNLGTLKQFNSLDWNDGTSTIRGQVFRINYRNSSSWPFLIVKDTSMAQEQEVYIMYENNAQYEQRIRTNYDGTFQFQNLIKGKYLVYLFSEDVQGGTEQIVKKYEVEIAEPKSSIVLDDIYIEQL